MCFFNFTSFYFLIFLNFVSVLFIAIQFFQIVFTLFTISSSVGSFLSNLISVVFIASFFFLLQVFIFDTFSLFHHSKLIWLVIRLLESTQVYDFMSCKFQRLNQVQEVCSGLLIVVFSPSFKLMFFYFLPYIISFALLFF